MTETPDYYRILQVHPSAGKEAIDAAYRALALKYHPDRNHSADAPEKMKRINEAYEILSHPEKRSAYDRARGKAITKASSGTDWSKLKIIVAILLLIIVIGRFKMLGLLLIGLLLAIWILRR